MQETRVRSLGWEGPLDKEMATHSSILDWRTPWTEEPGGLQSMGSQRVRHDWVTSNLAWKSKAVSHLISVTGRMETSHLTSILYFNKHNLQPCFNFYPSKSEPLLSYVREVHPPSVFPGAWTMFCGSEYLNVSTWTNEPVINSICLDGLSHFLVPSFSVSAPAVLSLLDSPTQSCVLTSLGIIDTENTHHRV